jgi:putative addiction module component (TIGR02574 family)
MGASAKALGIDRLSVADRLALIEEIWDSLVDEADSPEIPDSHLEELGRRLASRAANLGDGLTWEDRGPFDGPGRSQAMTLSSAEVDPGPGTTIEGRLEAVEQSIKELRRKVEARPVDPNWMDRFVGGFEDEEDRQAFEEVVRLGREFRMADRPAEDSGE